jgi:hypothetical protein
VRETDRGAAGQPPPPTPPPPPHHQQQRRRQGQAQLQPEAEPQLGQLQEPQVEKQQGLLNRSHCSQGRQCRHISQQNVQVLFSFNFPWPAQNAILRV